MPPCKECPFRKKAAPGYVGGHGDAMEIYQLISRDRKFPCHMEVTAIRDHIETELGDPDDPLGIGEDAAHEEACRQAPHCTGALIFMNNSAKLSRDPQIVKAQRVAGTSDQVFQTAAEFLTYHQSQAFAEQQKTLQPVRKGKRGTR